MVRLEPRGPDDAGVWADADDRAVFGFRRLAVVDLTPGGHQPMVGHGGTVLLYNGELYNRMEVVDSLARVGWAPRTRSDTEVVLASLERWGTSALDRFNGMFAIAWYDPASGRVVLARDHAGIKPLFYRQLPGGIAFGSQLDSLLRLPHPEPAVDVAALRAYLELGHVPPPGTVHVGVRQIQPGHVLTWTSQAGPTEVRWWHPPAPSRCAPYEIVERVGSVIDDAVARQLVADVTVGTFLSSGVDSPLVTAAARAQAGPGLIAFTVGFPGWRQDESEGAHAYAAAIGVEHRIVHPKPDAVAEAFAGVRLAMHEPLGDYSILPTYLVSDAASAEMTVALSGDGGDELWFGYERPHGLFADAADWRFGPSNRRARYLASRAGLGRPRNSSTLQSSPGAAYRGSHVRFGPDLLAAVAPALLDTGSADDLYTQAPTSDIDELGTFTRRADYLGQLQRVLRKVDLASMHRSLEVRVPLLDRNVVELAFSLYPSDVLPLGRKGALVGALGRRLGGPLVTTAEKMGFNAPLRDLLAPVGRSSHPFDVLGSDLWPAGMFDQRQVSTIVDGWMGGRNDHKWPTWHLAALQWYAQNAGLRP